MLRVSGQVAKEEAVAQWQATMRGYLAQRASEGRDIQVLLVIDARQSLRGIDRDFALWLDREVSVPLTIVMSKCDLLHEEELAKRYSLLEYDVSELRLRLRTRGGVYMISSKTGAGINLLREHMLKGYSAALPEKALRGRLQGEEEEDVASMARAEREARKERKERQARLDKKSRRGQDKRRDWEMALDKWTGHAAPFEEPRRISADFWARRKKSGGGLRRVWRGPRVRR